MSDDERPTEHGLGRYGINRRNVLRGIGAGFGLGVTGVLAADRASALGIDELVEIDIKPGSDPNAINCRSRGGTPVAILTTEDFDATTVEPSSLRFGKPGVVVSGGGASILHEGGHTEDVDGDDDMDFVGHFATQDTGFTADDMEGWLVGETEDGRRILGRDRVKLVGNCPEAEEGLPGVEIGTPVEQTTDDLPEPGPVPDEPVKPPEGYRDGEDAFREWKERARIGDVPQPPEDTVQAPDGGATSQASNEAVSIQQVGSIAPGAGYPGWENSELGATPPDTNIAVGPSKAVLAVNLRWGIYDKFSGTREFEVELEDWFAPVIDEDETFVFDPKALYDHHEDRFILIAVARNGEEQEGSWVVAVSDDENPFGTWWLTRIPHGGDSEWVDYPGLGVDANGIYLTANIFGFTGGFQYAKLVTIDKTPLYNGNSFTYWWFDDVRAHDGSRAFTIQPTHDTPATASGGSQYLVSSRWNSGGSLTLYELRNPTSTPRLFTYEVDVPTYSLPPNAEQPNTSNTLDTVDARLMNAVYENGSVWTAHSINYDWDGDGDASALLRWYEIDAGSASLSQARGWGRPNGDYFFPTVASDGESTMIVYNESGPETYPRIEVAGRTQGHTPNSLESVAIIKYGESEFAPGGRWGDYSGIVLNPGIEGDTYYVFSQYANDEETTNNWETWVGGASFDGVVIE